MSTLGLLCGAQLIAHKLLTLSLETDPAVAHVFFDYSPHVARLDVRAWRGGWSAGTSCDFEAVAFLGDHDGFSQAQAALRGLQSFLARCEAPAAPAARKKGAAA